MSQETIQAPGGPEVRVDPVGGTDGPSQRVEIVAEDGRQWRVDIGPEGETSIIETRKHSQLVDLDEPAWLGDVLVHFRVGA
jgi:hypothetical protein